MGGGAGQPWEVGFTARREPPASPKPPGMWARPPRHLCSGYSCGHGVRLGQGYPELFDRWNGERSGVCLCFVGEGLCSLSPRKRRR